jgi:hypothetical protein
MDQNKEHLYIKWNFYLYFLSKLIIKLIDKLFDPKIETTVRLSW